MRSRPAALAGLLLWTLGCARPAGLNPAPTEPLTLALAALERGDLTRATLHAEAVPPDEGSATSRQALLLRTLLALDPRNPARAPERAAALATQYVDGAEDPWDAALGRFLYSMALDLGAPPEAGTSTGAAMPRLAGPPLAARLQELERSLARLRGELARIQATLKS
jgi:hypothetical protein